jgi:hypothetical protein
VDGAEQAPPGGGQGRGEGTHTGERTGKWWRQGATARPETTALLLPVPQAPETLTQCVHLAVHFGTLDTYQLAAAPGSLLVAGGAPQLKI